MSIFLILSPESRRHDLDADHLAQQIDKRSRLFVLAAGKVECKLVPVTPIWKRSRVAECTLADEVEQSQFGIVRQSQADSEPVETVVTEAQL